MSPDWFVLGEELFQPWLHVIRALPARTRLVGNIRNGPEDAQLFVEGKRSEVYRYDGDTSSRK